MEARIRASVFLSLSLFCATLTAQQPDYYQAAATPGASASLVSDSLGQGFAAGPMCGAPCGGCETCSDCCGPWHLFSQCDDGLNFWGWLNAGVVGNTSSPGSRFNGPYNAIDRSNELMFNQMYLIAEKGLPSDCCCSGIGGRVDVIYGEDFFLAQSVGLENNPDGSPHWNGQYYGWAIPQAYVELGRSDLSVKLGHFYAPIGYEGLPAYTQARTPRAAGNFFYTKAYSYQFAGPFTQWGAIATWKPSDYWETQFALTNGWDTLDRQGQDNLNVTAYAKYSGDSGWWTSFGIVTGDDINNPGGLPITNAFTNRTRYSWLASAPVGCNAQYVFHQWLGKQDQGALDGTTAYWYGIDQYLYYKMNDCWKAGLRFEWFRDEDGTRVGLNRPSNPNKVPFVGNFYSVTAGLNWTPNDNLIVRPEIRYDWFDGDQVRQPYNDGTDSSQVLLGIDAILVF
jgi:hypothetical protein